MLLAHPRSMPLRHGLTGWGGVRWGGGYKDGEVEDGTAVTLFSVICGAKVGESRGRDEVRGMGKAMEGECGGGGGTRTVVEED